MSLENSRTFKTELGLDTIRQLVEQKLDSVGLIVYNENLTKLDFGETIIDKEGREVVPIEVTVTRKAVANTEQ